MKLLRGMEISRDDRDVSALGKSDASGASDRASLPPNVRIDLREVRLLVVNGRSFSMSNCTFVPFP